MNPIERVVHVVDRAQQRWNPVAFVVAVFKKYGDDRGGQLTGLIAFYAFLSFFPLTLVVVTLTAFVAQRQPALAERIRASALSQFPVVGAQLAGEEKVLPGSGLGLGVGLAGLLYAGFGVTQALQYAFHEVWHVPHKSRPPFVLRMARGVGVFALLASAVAVSTFLGLLGTFIAGSRLAGAVGLILALTLSAGLYLAVFWLLSPRTLPLVELVPGVIVAAVGWQALQTIGLRLVTHQLRRSSELYGVIGAALGLIGFLLIGSQVLLYALEVTVVRSQHLWPRSIVQPPLTNADKALLEAMARQEERRPEEHVTVAFEPESQPSPSPRASGLDVQEALQTGDLDQAGNDAGRMPEGEVPTCGPEASGGIDDRLQSAGVHERHRADVQDDIP